MGQFLQAAVRSTVRRSRFFLMLFFFLVMLCPVALYPQETYSLNFPSDEKGDDAVAERYASWSKNLVDDGRWAEALTALERASAFSSVSSDISYLLALARSHGHKPRGGVLKALEMALNVGRWKMYSPDDARLLKAENLIALGVYSEALSELSKTSKSPREAELTLKALLYYRPAEFLRYMTDILDRYPRENEPVRIFFSYLKTKDAAGATASESDLQLLELVVRRLPVLLLKDAELAWMAAPFMRDTPEAKRLVQAYRAVNDPVSASLPAALKLGVIDEEIALEELFGTKNKFSGAADASLDINLMGEVWGLLRREEARAIFRRNLLVFSGVISEDANRDGIIETTVEYSRGMLRQASYDAAQSGIPDMTIYFEAGDPRRADYLIPPENTEASPSRKEAVVYWERYPAVEEVEMEGARYIPRPLSFHFSPVKFEELWGSTVLFPRRDRMSPPLTRRVLVFQSLRIERPSLEFSKGKEVVELDQGIPVRAREYVGESMVAETDFIRGRPQLQRVDLDLDGKMETFRHFKRDYRSRELEELWDYDRNIDYTVNDD